MGVTRAMTVLDSLERPMYALKSLHSSGTGRDSPALTPRDHGKRNSTLLICCPVAVWDIRDLRPDQAGPPFCSLQTELGQQSTQPSQY